MQILTLLSYWLKAQSNYDSHRVKSVDVEMGFTWDLLDSTWVVLYHETHKSLDTTISQFYL